MSEHARMEIRSERKITWLRVLVGGLVIYSIGMVILILTENPNLFPTVVMIGNFLMPVTFVAFLYERRHWSKLSLPTTALSFFYGGVWGVLAASILEPIFIRQIDFVNMFVVGLIEESAKILGVLFIARRWQHNAEMDGLILGAAAGMGFAALESTGYAFTAFLLSGGSLTATVGVTLVRGILSPLGHGTWTAILASVLFRESGQRRFRINLNVLGAYAAVVILHGLWDGAPALIAAVLSPGLDVFVGQSLIAGIGLFILWRRWQEARRLQVEREPAVLDADALEALAPSTQPVEELTPTD